MFLGFPRHAVLILGEVIVWNLNLRFGFSTCERAILASRASLGPDPRGNCDALLILESDLLLRSCLR